MSNTIFPTQSSKTILKELFTTVQLGKLVLQSLSKKIDSKITVKSFTVISPVVTVLFDSMSRICNISISR